MLEKIGPIRFCSHNIGATSCWYLGWRSQIGKLTEKAVTPCIFVYYKHCILNVDTTICSSSWVFLYLVDFHVFFYRLGSLFEKKLHCNHFLDQKASVYPSLPCLVYNLFPEAYLEQSQSTHNVRTTLYGHWSVVKTLKTTSIQGRSNVMCRLDSQVSIEKSNVSSLIQTILLKFSLISYRLDNIRLNTGP